MSRVYIREMINRYGLPLDRQSPLSASAVLYPMKDESHLEPEYFITNSSLPKIYPQNFKSKESWKRDLDSTHLGPTSMSPEKLNGFYQRHDGQIEKLIKNFIYNFDLKDFLLNPRYSAASLDSQYSIRFMGLFDKGLAELQRSIWSVIQEDLKHAQNLMTQAIDEAISFKKHYMEDHLSFISHKVRAFIRDVIIQKKHREKPMKEKEVMGMLDYLFSPYLPYHRLFVDLNETFVELTKDLKAKREKMNEVRKDFEKEKEKIKNFLVSFKTKEMEESVAAGLKTPKKEEEKGELASKLKEEESQISQKLVNPFEYQPDTRKSRVMRKMEEEFSRNNEQGLPKFPAHYDPVTLARLFKVTRDVETLHSKFEIITSFAEIPGEEKVFTGSTDGKICLTNYGSGMNGGILTGHGGPVKALSYSKRRNRLYSGSGDGSIRVWDLATNSCIGVLWKHKEWVWGVKEIEKMSLIVSAGDDGTVRFWNDETLECEKVVYSPEEQGIRALTELSVTNANFVYAGGWTIYEIDCQTQKIKREFQGHQYYVRSIVLLYDENMLISGGEDHVILVFSWSSQDIVFKATAEGEILALQVIAARVLASSTSWGISFWDLQSSLRPITQKKLPVASHLLYQMEKSYSLIFANYNKLHFLQ